MPNLLQRDQNKKIRLVIFLTFFAVVGVATLILTLAAPVPSPNSKFLSYEELTSQGKLAPVVKILQVDLAYDARANPKIKIVGKNVKNGYVPQNVDSEKESSYKLEVLDGASNTLTNLPFNVPNQTTDTGPTKLSRIDFSLTMAYSDQANRLSILDHDGSEVVAASLQSVTQQNNLPSFKALPQNDYPANAAHDQNPNMLEYAFISVNYSPSQINEFYNDVTAAAVKMSTKEPFRSYYLARKIDFYSIENYQTLGCKVTTVIQGEGNINCSHSKVVTAVNNSGVPYDRIYVMYRSPIHAGNSYVAYDWTGFSILGGVMAMGTNNYDSSGDGSLTFVHEEGHSTAGLWDEYSPHAPADLDGEVHQNCYFGNVIPAAQWVNLVPLSNYYQGCASPNQYRSSRCSMMTYYGGPNPICNYFNKVSQGVAKKRISKFAGTYYNSVSPQASSGVAQNSHMNGLATIPAVATDDQGVGWTELWIDSQLTDINFGSESSDYPFTWDTTRTANGSHQLLVKAIDEAGNVGRSGSVTVVVDNSTSDTQPPTTPTNFQATGLSQTCIELTWDASTDNVGVTGYHILRDGYNLTDVESPGHDDCSAHPGITYHYSVAAYDAAGNYSGYAQATGTTQSDDVTPPTNPPYFDGHALDATRIKLTWQASSDDHGVAGYKIYRDSLDNQIAETQNLAYTDTGRTPSTGYWYYIYAYDQAGNLSNYSSAHVSTPGNDVSPPSMPRNFRVDSVSYNRLNLAWTASTDDSGYVYYKLYRDTFNNFYRNVYTNSFSDTGLPPNTTKKYWIAAWDGAGNNTEDSKPYASGTTSSPPGDTQPPSTPTNFHATATGPFSIVLSWDRSTDNTGVAGYRFQTWHGGVRCNDDPLSNPPYCATPNTSYRDQNVAACIATFTYYVQAYDYSGNFSTSASATSNRWLQC